MFCLGAAAMAGRPPLQGIDDIAGDISDKKLGHKPMLLRDSTTNNARMRQGCSAAASPARRATNSASTTPPTSSSAARMKAAPGTWMALLVMNQA